MKYREVFLVSACLVAITFAVLAVVYNNPTHYDIVIKHSPIMVHTPSYHITDGYVCTPSICIPEKRVKEIRVIRNCKICKGR